MPEAHHTKMQIMASYSENEIEINKLTIKPYETLKVMHSLMWTRDNICKIHKTLQSKQAECRIFSESTNRYPA